MRAGQKPMASSCYNTDGGSVSEETLRIGAKNPEIKVKSHEIGTKNHKMGAKNHEINTKSPETGMKNRRMGMKDHEANVKSPEIGMKNLRMGMKDHETNVKSPETGMKNYRMGVKNHEIQLIAPRSRMAEASPSKPGALPRGPSPVPVAFLNVAHSYVPGTKVECHYTLPPGTKPSARDWIGIFKVEAASVKDYYTFVWCPVPEGGPTGVPLHSSVQFQANYLPPPGAQQYQYRYVDRRGEERGRSSPFQFSEPRPMDELVTLEGDEDGNMDMLLVVPKATLLQNQLEESQQERSGLARDKQRLEEEVKELQARLELLEVALSGLRAEHSKLTEQYKDLSGSHAAVTEERDALSQQQAGHLARIRTLEEDVQAISAKVLQKEVELDRMKDTVKAMMREQERIHHQLKEESAEKEHYQVKLRGSEQEGVCLAGQLHRAEAQRTAGISQALALKQDINKLQQKLAAAQQRTAQLEALSEQLRCTQDLLAASQQKVALLGEELASAASIRDRTIADLHKSRLESAETNIKLADMTLKWKEGKGQWGKEKSSLLQSMEHSTPAENPPTLC
ncbi:calcium-binding and coiled-coil domain-containing protein 1 isoform A [Alligator mississippiensis]|uniref:Calcium-binding and coiled-coil domain-containing protein 1 isoform A n=1 Tax=Alligator mississippiensis TaxID=8496 RepID=A0A151P642_ALLMI|nr:calcium-binding and coiled-coil domain-containing protein 1 isoform A [Alligator mississippiensis]